MTGRQSESCTRMTTREAIAICREQAAKETGPTREALNLCALIAENHVNRNRKNKKRQRERAKAPVLFDLSA